MEGVQYCGGCSLIWRMFSTVEGVQYRNEYGTESHVSWNETPPTSTGTAIKSFL